MDVRGRRLRKQSDRALAFTSSMESDWRIARPVIAVNIAHMASLVHEGLVDPETGGSCIRFLLGYNIEGASGRDAEDFHQLLEQDAVDSLGVDVAGWMNYGKSRNDQVATAIRMQMRTELLVTVDAISALQDALLTVAERDGKASLPGYTHLQRAQPLTLAHYCFAHFDSLSRDAERALQLYDRVNVSPMGSAALAGTDVPLDRRSVGSILGFPTITKNAMDSVSSRDLLVEALSCLAILMVDVGRMAEEQILWSSAEFGFLRLDDAYSASSSIMPQKKNPVVAEIARAKAGSVLGNLVAVVTILKSLPYSYNLDLQESTPQLWAGFDSAVSSTRMIAAALSSSSFNRKAMGESLKDDTSTATALANYLVSSHKVPFRVAHSVVGELVALSERTRTPLPSTVARKIESTSRRAGFAVKMTEAEARRILDPSGFLAAIKTEGGSNPRFISAEAKDRRLGLSAQVKETKVRRALVETAEKKLVSVASRISKEVKRRD